MNNSNKQKTWFQKYKLPLLLAVIACGFYVAGMMSMVNRAAVT